MTHSANDSSADLVGAAVAAAILAAEHLAIYPNRDRLHPTARYALGVLGLGLGYTLACAFAGDTRAALRFWRVVVAGGGTVLALYAAKGELPAPPDWLTEVREFLNM